MKRVLSGVQPTGNLHLGNYLGAIRNWVKLQDGYECFYMVADLHAITVPQAPDDLRRATREVTAALIACGIDLDKSAIFPQSAVAAHSELAWILSCHTQLGWLTRMTQFKEKRGVASDTNFLEKIEAYGTASSEKEKKEALKALKEDQYSFGKANLGLFSYPVLMAADILVYKATHVPVGHDQKQHLELCRDIAGAFNRQYPLPNPPPQAGEGTSGFFPLPEPLILGEATRVMSLRDGTKKMSKSDESDYSRINLTDDADSIAKKIKKATSDSYATIGENIDNRPEANNLLTLYAALKGVSREVALAECGDKNFSAFKQMLTDVAVAHLSPITAKMRELLAAPDYIDQALAKGVSQAGAVAGKTMKEVKELVGFLAPK